MQQNFLKRHFTKMILLTACQFSMHSHAEINPTAIAFDIGESKNDVWIYRVGLQQDFSGWLAEKNIPLGGYFEGSINYWDGKHDDSYGIALSPVFYYQFCADCTVSPYIEGGIGASLFTKKTIDGKEMSSNYQFEDRIGVGVKIGQFDYHFRYMHYSNAGLKDPNQGMDIFIGGMTYKF